MGKRHRHHYEVIDTNQVLALVKSGALSDEQRVRYFDRVVLEYDALLRSAQDINAALSSENAGYQSEIIDLEGRLKRLKKHLNARKRGGCSSHRGLKKQHRRRRGHAIGVEPESNGFAADDDIDYEAIAAKYADLEEPEDDAGCEENVASVAGDE